MLDYLRLVAALSVVCFHYFHDGIRTGRIAGLDSYPVVEPLARYGYLGVHLVFLISGYVIASSSRGKTARQFVVGRALRLLPAFWASVAITSLVVAVAGKPAGLRVTLNQVFLNLTMVPSLFGVDPVDGVYWTLLLEIQFYFLVFLFIMAGQRHLFTHLLPWWAVGMLAVNVAAPSYELSFPYVGGYFALFAGGALIAEIHAGGVTAMRVLGLLCSVTVATRFSTRLAAYVTENEGVAYHSAVIVVALLIFFGVMLCLNLRIVRDLKPPGAVAVGALTYPIYLLHASIGYVALAHAASVDNMWLAYALVFALVVGLALLVHHGVEIHMRPVWVRMLEATAGRAAAAIQGYAWRTRQIVSR